MSSTCLDCQKGIWSPYVNKLVRGIALDKREPNFAKSIIIRRVLNIFLAAFLLLGAVFYLVKMPVRMAGWFVPFEVETSALVPIKVENAYAKVIGFDRVKIVHENPDQSLTIWVTSEIGWNNVASWDEKTKLMGGTTAYYTETADAHLISWRMEEVEYSIEFEGNEPLSKEKLIEMASSISITRFAME